MKIAIVAPFCSLPGEAYFNRFLYLAEQLAQKHDVLLMTSDFRHFDKRFRRAADRHEAQGRLQIKLLHETGYEKNVSLRRLASHRVFVRNLANEVAAWPQGAFDVVYSAYPLMGSNLVLAKHKKRAGFRLIVDVQDVWPEAFAAVLPFIGKLPPRMLPFARRADRAYAAADALAAVSQTYLARARAANPDVPAAAVYIGADMEQLSAIRPHAFPQNGTLRLCYLGTLSHSYDVASVCRAVRLLCAEGLKTELHIIGTGGSEAVLKNEFADTDSVVFHGAKPYAESMALAKGCHIAVNPIHGHALQSITNKLSDYAALGLPILNSQRCPEARALMAGLPHAHYPSGDAAACAAALRRLAAEPGVMPSADGHSGPAACENRRIPQAVADLLDRRRSYRKLIELIECQTS